MIKPDSFLLLVLPLTHLAWGHERHFRSKLEYPPCREQNLFLDLWELLHLSEQGLFHLPLSRHLV